MTGTDVALSWALALLVLALGVLVTSRRQRRQQPQGRAGDEKHVSDRWRRWSRQERRDA